MKLFMKALVIIFILFIALSIIFWDVICPDFILIKRFETPWQYEVVIYEENIFEISHFPFYEVSGGDKVIIPKTIFYKAIFHHQKPQFKMINSKSERMITIVESSDPNSILILHNFDTGMSWPYCGENEDKSTCVGLEECLKVFRLDYPGRHFELYRY